MKIVHIAPSAPYNDYWGYQDNLLPKYHKKLGHDVTIIVTNRMHKDGKITETECADYILNDGVRVIRRKYKQYLLPILTTLNGRLDGVFPLLQELQPDFIFYHGLISTTIYDVVRYKKRHYDCVVVEDSHLDYNNARGANTVKDKIVRAFYRYINHRYMPFVERVYGVTPWRKTFAEDYFKIPIDKTDVLIMGADDEKIDFTHHDEIRKRIRDQYYVAENDFLIVTGGKIDKKKGIDLLMEAVSNRKDVKLIVFGQVSDELRERFDRLISENPNIIYIGWIDADKVYDYFFAADIVMFPGGHSVLWEQACAAKVPCVFEHWEGMEHVNNGGNSDFFDDISVDSIASKIEELHFTPKYQTMKEVAESENTDIYLYSRIAKKSLECSRA